MEYIYTLTDPRNNTVRYVGRTKDVKQRLRSHITSASSNPVKRVWIDEIRAANLSPILTVIEEIEDCSVKQREAYWIYFYLDQGIPLVNNLREIATSYRRK